MHDKFHLDDFENPSYEYSQVITFHDLMTIYEGLVVQHKNTRWYQFHLRYGLMIARYIIYEILEWLREGKPKLRDSGDI